jgi:hypothetical protein
MCRDRAKVTARPGEINHFMPALPQAALFIALSSWYGFFWISFDALCWNAFSN